MKDFAGYLWVGLWGGQRRALFPEGWTMLEAFGVHEADFEDELDLPV